MGLFDRLFGHRAPAPEPGRPPASTPPDGVAVVIRTPMTRLAFRRTLTDFLWAAVRDAAAGQVTGDASRYGEDGRGLRYEHYATLTAVCPGLAAVRRTLREFGWGPEARVIRLGPGAAESEYPAALDPAWRTDDVVGLARAIEADEAFDRLPILADALTEAGCEDQMILGHCRREGPHVRGCWVVDLVLDKVSAPAEPGG